MFKTVIAVALVSGYVALAEGEGSSMDRYRAELRDLHVLQDFRPMKNSFIVGLEGMCKRPQLLKAGDRQTLLDTKGAGSLRHVWETHGPGEPSFTLEFFVDGETEPSLHGAIGDLTRAALRCEQPFVAQPASIVVNDSHNIYLPIPFAESLRVDLVARAPGGPFIQLDYRLDDDSLNGVRLVQEGEGPEMVLRYEGPLPARAATPVPETTTHRPTFVGDGSATLEGPGIIRRLSLGAVRRGVTLRVYFDGAESPAVDVDTADFFGPYRGVAFNNNSCYLPMPFKASARIEIFGGSPNEEWRIEADVEPVAAFGADWGYFHARYHAATGPTNGFDNYPVLHTLGRGHWLGMNLIDSGMDHGGGDFVVVDGGTPDPAFLHGINGEDYFSFAFFGKGENFPYTEAFENEVGRLRLHLENAYPFRESIAVSWGTLRNLQPRSVALFYLDQPVDRSESGQVAPGWEWDVFGPVDTPTLADGNTPDTSSAEKLFERLPDPAVLDAGESVEATHTMFSEVFRGQFEGWAKQRAVGPHLNLMYVYRHVMDLGGHSHMGYYARCMMARASLTTPEARTVIFQLSHDDPIEVRVNGGEVYRDLSLRRGFTTKTFPVTLKAGQNEVLVRMADTPNTNTCWAALSLRVLDEAGEDITGALQ